jgi:hypothetical protein
MRLVRLGVKRHDLYKKALPFDVRLGALHHDLYKKALPFDVLIGLDQTR